MATQHASRRAAIISAVEQGRLTPEQGDILAARRGVQIEMRPDPAEFDPAKAIGWTPAMAIAWIMTGDVNDVRDLWPNYRQAHLVWQSADLRLPNGRRIHWQLRSLGPVTELDLLFADSGRFDHVEAGAELIRAGCAGRVEGIVADPSPRVLTAAEWICAQIGRNQRDEVVLVVAGKVTTVTLSPAAVMQAWPVEKAVPAGRRGRKPEYDWVRIRRRFFVRMKDEGGPPGEGSVGMDWRVLEDAVRHVMELCVAVHGKECSRSKAQEKAKLWIAEWESGGR